MPFKVYFAPMHRDEGPVRPGSADEFADVVDRMRALRDFDLTYAFITYGDDVRKWAGLYAVAVNPDEDHGSLMFADPVRGNLYSKASVISPPCGCGHENFPHIGYSEFANHRPFPLDSQVPVADLKAALRLLYEDPSTPPANLEWREWEWD